MNITKNNYEVWFLDYFEQQLSAEQVAELFLFLEQHPALKEEFDSVENSISTPIALEQEPLPHKETLKKFNTVSAENIHEWLIADMEGDLNLTQSTALLTFLKAHPTYKAEQALYKKCRLDAKNEETFPNKHTLRKGVVIPFYQHPSFFRVAAILLLCIGGAILFSVYKQNSQPDRRFVEIKDTLSLPQNTEQRPPSPIEEKKFVSNDSILPSKLPTKEKIKQQREIAPAIKPENNTYAQKVTATKRPKKSSLQEEMPAPLNREEDNFMAMELKSSGLLPIENVLIPVERRYTPKATPAYNLPQEPPSLLQVLQATRMGQEVKEVTAKGIKTVLGEENESALEQTIDLPFKSRLLRFVANSFSKISRNKVKVRTTFNPITGKLSAYEIETRKKTIQKQFDPGKFYTENK